MLLLLILFLVPETGLLTVALRYILWGNAIVGVILALFAFIVWVGTDRSHEILELEAEGHSLRRCDHDLLSRYEARALAFWLHIILCATLGILGWWFAWTYIAIPSEDASETDSAAESV